jgi:hypothetical protein
MNKIFRVLSDLLPGNNEKEPFLIKITDAGPAKLYIKKLIRIIRKYPELQQNPKDTIKLSQLQLGDMVIFGESSSFDYTIIEEIKGDRELMKLRKYTMYDLVKNENRIANAIERYVEKHSKRPCRCTDDVDINITITVENDAPVKKKPTSFDVVDIFDTFVRVGYHIYDIRVDLCTGKEWVIIGGDAYQVKTNWCGKKYLA